MFKYCKKCGIQTYENAPICSNCGKRFDETKSESTQPEFKKNIDLIEEKSSFFYKEPVAFKDTFSVESTGYKPYEQDSTSGKKTKNKTKLITIVISAIIIIAAIAVFYQVVQSEEKEKTEFETLIDSLTENKDKYSLSSAKTKIDGGPTLNFQSLASGNFRTIPDEGTIAKYNLYYNDIKIGEINEGAVATDTVQNNNYLLIIGNSEFEIETLFDTIACTTDYHYYIEADSKMPVFLSMNYDYTQPNPMTMQTELTWNQETSEIKSTVKIMGQSVTVTSNLPVDYWNMISSIDDLYLGYSKDLEYTMNIQGKSYDVSLSFIVSDIEDVIVPAGNFANCYILEFEQDLSALADFGYSKINMKLWLSEDGIVPKAEVLISSMEITQELEGYYTT